MSSAVIASIAFLVFGASASAQAQQSGMSFFITSVGLGKGGDLDGLEGADRHCQSLAQAAGAGNKTWRAYLSTQGPGGVNAKDRIGNGPWFNARGVQIAANVADLHSDNNKTGLDEKGMAVKGRGDTPNQHDMLTGTQHGGTAVPGADDVYKPRLDLTDGVWLSDRVLMSDVIRRRLFSPSSSAWRQGRFASGSCRSTSVLDAASPRCIRASSDRDRPAARRATGRPSCGTPRGRTR
jgi:hypothetical protein